MLLSKIGFLIKGIKIDLLILAACILIFIPFSLFVKPSRVGDGSEYYALELALRSTHKPYMTEASWAEYGNLVDSGKILGLLDASQLKNTILPSRLDSTGDFIHFWFYSLCAAVISVVMGIVGIKIPVQTAFLAFHCLLLSCLFIISWRCFRWKGLIAAGLLTFLSPMIWYFDKVHTELFTYCVTTSAIILFLKRHYVLSAFFLACAATQNISFAAISLFVLGLDLLSRRKIKYSVGEIALLVLTMGILAINPTYYYIRYGILNPFLSLGGASIGGNFTFMLIWFFDPDLGLFPNWPFGIALLALSFFALRSRKMTRSSLSYWAAFVVCYVGVSLFAQSSTTNLNAAGSPGLARYALWYLGLFFPAILVSLERFKKSKRFASVLVVFIIAGILYGAAFFNPLLDENGYTRPSAISYWLQKNWPGFYNPPPEIFGERYSGIGESSNVWDALAVIGPDCHKALLMNTSNDGQVVLGALGCAIDMDKVSHIIKHDLADETWGKNVALRYVMLNEAEIKESRFIPQIDQWYLTASGSVSLQGTGWSQPKSWGTWSEGKQPSLAIPCPIMIGSSSLPASIELELRPFTAPSHPQINFSIYVGQDLAWSGSLDDQKIVKINIPNGVCPSNTNLPLNFTIDNPASPLSLGLSTDRRELGVGLIRFRFVAR